MLARVEREGRRYRWLASAPRAFPLIVFVLALILTVLTVALIERAESRANQRQIDRTGQDVGIAFERRLLTNIAYLRAGAALFSSSDEVTPELFRRFVDELRIESTFAGSDGVGWAPVVRPDGLADYRTLLNTQGNASADLTPSFDEQPRRFAVPVTFLLPDTVRNRRALGYDMYSDEDRRKAMDHAVSTVAPAATAPVILRQEGSEQSFGFIIYMPAFEPGSVDRLKGFIYSPINFDTLLSSIAPASLSETVAITIKGVGNGGNEVPLATLGPRIENGYTAGRDVMVAGQEFRIETSMATQRSLTPLSTILLVAGLVIATLGSLVARMVSRRALENQQRLDWFEEQNSIRDSLTRELNHRVKNTLANVLSIIALTRRRSDNLDDFANSLDGRVRSLSATHDLLTQSEWGTTPIQAVVDAELAPYSRGGDASVHREGPDVELAPNDALSLGMALHELATNAAKFGALSVPGGEVHIDWRLIEPNIARLVWEERGGPPVAEATRRGFGVDLIEKIIAQELRHPVQLDFHETGVRCDLTIPVRRLSEFALRAEAMKKNACAHSFE